MIQTIKLNLAFVNFPFFFSLSSSVCSVFSRFKISTITFTLLSFYDWFWHFRQTIFCLTFYELRNKKTNKTGERKTEQHNNNEKKKKISATEIRSNQIMIIWCVTFVYRLRCSERRWAKTYQNEQNKVNFIPFHSGKRLCMFDFHCFIFPSLWSIYFNEQVCESKSKSKIVNVCVWMFVCSNDMRQATLFVRHF